jgi:hypothetical protein
MSFDYEHHLLTNIPLIYTTNCITNYSTNLNNTCILKPVRRWRDDIGETAVGAEMTRTSVTATERRRSGSMKYYIYIYIYIYIFVCVCLVCVLVCVSLIIPKY